MPVLKSHMGTAGLVCAYDKRGAMETELALRLYYLGCSEAMTNLNRKADEALRPMAGTSPDEVPDVTSARCRTPETRRGRARKDGGPSACARGTRVRLWSSPCKTATGRAA